MEYIDIYNENKELTGITLPRKTKLKEGQYMLYVLALIECNGKYLVTQRTMDKKWAAGAWEIPGGGASAGETSLVAMQREILEETGLDVTKGECSLLYSYRNEDLKRGDNYFTDIYLCKLDFAYEDVKVQEREVLDYKLASLQDIHTLHKTNGFLHYERILEALKNRS